MSDKTTVVSLLTRDLGKTSYSVYGRGRNRNILFTPLTVIDIEPARQRTGSMPTLRDYSLTYIPENIQNDIRRTACALFIAETLYRTQSEPEPDKHLFDFVRQTVIQLDTLPEPAGVHVAFLTEYISLLGFAPDWDAPENADLRRLLNLSGQCTRSDRHCQLDQLMLYYNRHLPDFVTPKSLDVLKQVFD